MQLSVIVVAFGEDARVRECLTSIDAALELVPGEAELIVVLNRVSDVVRRELEAATTRRILVDAGRNLGFAAGVNAGLERAQGEWIALVNDDCVVEPEALRELLEAGAASTDIGSVAAQILFAGSGGIINSVGIDVDQLGIAYERALGEPASPPDAEVTEVFGASAGTGLYRREMLKAVGGFDTSFFAYLEDADLAWRARMHGWRCVCAPRAVAWHHHSSSLGHRSDAKYFLVGRNRVRMLAKNASREQLVSRGVAIVVYDLAYVALAAARDKTLAPLRGRLCGLLEWRSYRRRNARRAVSLTRPRGIWRALTRDRIYRAT